MRDKYRCKFIKENGERCRAIKQKDSDYCIYHDKETVKKNRNIIDEIEDGIFTDLGLNESSW
ncbi:hypothetical protein GF354_05195, partial [Candidatus Peregrinibacteria bacterium]|nr:hypothetical protein [Candidatus Peregrinibacteria bacterium]